MATKASSLHWNYGPYHANRFTTGMELWASTPIEGADPTMTRSIPWVLSSVPPEGSQWLWRYGVIRASHMEDFEDFITEYRAKCPGCLHPGISLTPAKVTWDQYLDMFHAADRAGICNCSVARTTISNEYTYVDVDCGYWTTVYRYTVTVDSGGYIQEGIQWTPPGINNVWFDLLIKGYEFDNYYAERETWPPPGYHLPDPDHLPPPESPAIGRLPSGDNVSGCIWSSRKHYYLIDTVTGKATSGIHEELAFDLTRRRGCRDPYSDALFVELDGYLIEDACLVLRTYGASGSP